MSEAVVGLPSRTVWRLLDIAPSTLNYWVQLGLVTPTIREPGGRRLEQWWTVGDVVVARTIRELRRHGVSMQAVRRIAAQLASRQENLASSRLCWDGSDVVIVDEDGGLTSALQHPGQQMFVYAHFPLGVWHRQFSEVSEVVPSSVLARQSRLEDLDARLRKAL